MRGPEGSFSKLNTWRDGFRILGTILKLYRSEKPLRFFTAIGIFLMLVSIGLAIPVVVTFLEEGIVPRLPTAVLVDGSDDRGGAVGFVRAGARHGDARPARDEAARVFVTTAGRQELIPRGDRPRPRPMLFRVIAFDAFSRREPVPTSLENAMP